MGEPTAYTAPLIIAAMFAVSCLAGYISYILFEDSAAKFFKKRPRQEYLSWQYFQASKRLIPGALAWVSNPKKS